MHLKSFLTFILIFIGIDLAAQKGSFSISVDKDTMFQDEVVRVELLLDNVQGQYTQPEFDAFRIVGGPNTSSSFSMINGEISQKKSYTYLLLPESTGELTIGAASLQTPDDIIKTEPIKITVMEGSGRSERSPSNKRIYKSDQISEKDKTDIPTNKKRVLKKI